MHAPRETLDVLVPHTGRIHSLEALSYEQERETFRALGGMSGDDFNRLTLSSIEDALNNTNPEEALRGSLHTLEQARQHKNTLGSQTGPVTSKHSSFTAFVINDTGTTTTVPLQLPSVKALRLVMKDTPALLPNLTCHLLKTLDIVVNDLSKERWWDVLCTSLAYLRLESLAVDVTLAREKNDWTNL